VFSKLLPDWGELLTVSTPRSIEFNEDILRCSSALTVEFLSDELEDWSVIRCWDLLGFHMWLEVTGLDFVEPLLNSFSIPLRSMYISCILGHIGWHDHSDAWKILIGDSHEFSELLLDLNSLV